MKKPRIKCFNCQQEKIITQSVCWIWKNYNLWFCTKTCTHDWIDKNTFNYKKWQEKLDE